MQTPAHNADFNTPESVLRILIIEDSPTGIRFLTQALSGAAYDCIIATDGESGIRLAREALPRLILLDIQMPGIDGYETCRKLKQDPATADIPVIFLTSMADTASKLQGFQAGAIDYLTKPSHPEEVIARVRTHVENYRLHHELQDAVTALTLSTERFEAAARGSNDGLWDWNLHSNEIYYSPRWFTMLGFDADSKANHPEFWLERIHPGDRESVERAIRSHLDGATEQLEIEYRIADRGKQTRWVLTRGVALRQNDGTVTRMAGSQTDITSVKVIDRTTGLPNRLTFIDRLEQTRRDTDESGGLMTPLAVIVLELDRHKVVANTLGRDLADQISRAAGERIDARLRRGLRFPAVPQGSLLACIGDGVFAVLISGARDREAIIELSKLLIDDVRMPFNIDTHRIASNMHAGITFQNTADAEPEQALAEAEAALHEARGRSADRYRIYDKTIRAKLRSRQTVENELWRIFNHRGNHAEADKYFELVYQPIVQVDNGEVTGCEALIRWNHRHHGQLNPMDFIPLAEQCGAIVPLGEWVISAACRQYHAWARAGLTPPQIAINVSRRQLQELKFPESLQRILSDYRMPSGAIKIEITESVAMQDLEFTINTLSALRETGTQIAMDDFGTGYSSLSYLARLPLDAVKIDRAFISGVTDGGSNRALVDAILGIARSLGLTVIAEGVETKPQFDYLNAAGCEQAQGYLISPPLPVAEFSYLLTHGLDW